MGTYSLAAARQADGCIALKSTVDNESSEGLPTHAARERRAATLSVAPGQLQPGSAERVDSIASCPDTTGDRVF